MQKVGKTESHLETWLKDTMGQQSFSKHFAIERAHRFHIRTTPPSGAPLRAMIACILHFQDKRWKLESWKIYLLYYGKTNAILYFPDFSASTPKQTVRPFFQQRHRDQHIYVIQHALLSQAVGGDLKENIFFSQVAFYWLNSKRRYRARNAPNHT